MEVNNIMTVRRATNAEVSPTILRSIRKTEEQLAKSNFSPEKISAMAKRIHETSHAPSHDTNITAKVIKDSNHPDIQAKIRQLEKEIAASQENSKRIRNVKKLGS